MPLMKSSHLSVHVLLLASTSSRMRRCPLRFSPVLQVLRLTLPSSQLHRSPLSPLLSCLSQRSKSPLCVHPSGHTLHPFCARQDFSTVAIDAHKVHPFRSLSYHTSSRTSHLMILVSSLMSLMGSLMYTTILSCSLV